MNNNETRKTITKTISDNEAMYKASHMQAMSDVTDAALQLGPRYDNLRQTLSMVSLAAVAEGRYETWRMAAKIDDHAAEQALDDAEFVRLMVREMARQATSSARVHGAHTGNAQIDEEYSAACVMAAEDITDLVLALLSQD